MELWIILPLKKELKKIKKKEYVKKRKEYYAKKGKNKKNKQKINIT